MYNSETLIKFFYSLKLYYPNISKLWIHTLTHEPSTKNIVDCNIALERLLITNNSKFCDLSKMNLLTLYCIANC